MKKNTLISAAIFAYCMLHTACCFSQGTAINSTGAVADSSAMLDVSSTNKGLLIPRMSAAERNAVISPAEGLLIYNTSSQCYEGYNAAISQWVSFGCIGCQLPGTFTASAASGITQTSFTANWSSSTGATTYYLDVATDAGFSSFVTNFNNLNAGLVTNFSVTGLSCGTTYYYRVRAYNNCGTGANSNSVTDTTSACFSCSSSFQISHLASGGIAPVDKTVTYGAVASTLGGTGDKCWITQNLGATNQAATATDDTEAAAGWYWQFNRKQGYKHDGSSRTPNTAWITPIDENSNWLTANDPCTSELGAGWRIPTYTEWLNADAAGGWTNLSQVFASVLKLHAAGYLEWNNGSLNGRNFDGYYCSTLQYSNTQSWNLGFFSGASGMNSNNKSFAFSLRCLRD